MHPAPTFRPNDPAVAAAIVAEIGFGTVFAETPDGPRVAHAALFPTGDGAVQFHLSRRNALSGHLARRRALCVVNGPDAYVSPTWYEGEDDVPTWNYVAVEMEGPVRRMEREGLVALLDDLAQRDEARARTAPAWTRDRMPAGRFEAMAEHCVGFEMEIAEWRTTLKLSQDKDARSRQGVIDALEARGSAVAEWMRTLA